MTHLISKPDHGEKIIEEEGIASQRLQLYLDDIETGLNVFILDGFTVVDLTVIVAPASTPKIPASSRKRGMVMVDSPSPNFDPLFPAWSDGLVWRKVSDNTVVT